MTDKVDNVLRLSVSLIIIVWLFSQAFLYQAEYPTQLVKLYREPLWRILLIVLVIAAFMWCQNVGILLALAVIMYITDLDTLTRGEISAA
jgi:hypothetical protein